MIRVVILIAASIALAGCQTDQNVPAPQVSITGPSFAATQFDCGKRPLPPDPTSVGNAAGSAAAHYENRLGTWGQQCQNRLTSVGDELSAAGQVVRSSDHAVH